jgi:endonuclease/exonuclease/phosphatase family metal-dependent hydrolase
LPEPFNPRDALRQTDIDGDPTSRIDYVFVSKDVEADGTYVKADETAGRKQQTRRRGMIDKI